MIGEWVLLCLAEGLLLVVILQGAELLVLQQQLVRMTRVNGLV